MTGWRGREQSTAQMRNQVTTDRSRDPSSDDLNELQEEPRQIGIIVRRGHAASPLTQSYN